MTSHLFDPYVIELIADLHNSTCGIRVGLLSNGATFNDLQ